MRPKAGLPIFAMVLAAFTVLLSACGPTQASTPVVVASAPAQKVQLKFTALRILDMLPMYVAQQEGFFDRHGISVQLIPAGSPTERDQLVASGQADGMINEISGTLFFNKDKVQVQIVRFARAATNDTHLFSILASKKSGITTVDGLKGAPVGISDGTIIAYLTDRMLAKEGFSPADIKTVSVPSLSDRMALLNSGDLKAAMLPEPMTSLAVQQGAVVVLDDSKYPDYSSSTIAFSKTVIDQHPEAVRGFLAAIEDAVKAINADPAKYQNLMVDQKVVPAPLKGSFKVPQFVTAGVPTEAQFKDVLDWVKSKGLLSKDETYSDCVNPSLLP